MFIQCVVMHRYNFLKLGLQLILYCTPTAPGNSRIFYIMLADKRKLSIVTKVLAALTPTWAVHLVRNATLDGDNIFLHVQVSPHLRKPDCRCCTCAGLHQHIVLHCSLRM